MELEDSNKKRLVGRSQRQSLEVKFLPKISLIFFLSNFLSPNLIVLERLGTITASKLWLYSYSPFSLQPRSTHLK